MGEQRMTWTGEVVGATAQTTYGATVLVEGGARIGVDPSPWPLVALSHAHGITAG